MAGLVPAIHVYVGSALKTWMPGTRPGMTKGPQKSYPRRQNRIYLVRSLIGEGPF